MDTAAVTVIPAQRAETPATPNPVIPPNVAWTLRDGDDLDFGYTSSDSLYDE